MLGLGNKEKIIVRPEGAGDLWLCVQENIVKLQNLTLVIEKPRPILFAGFEFGIHWKPVAVAIQVIGTAQIQLNDVVMEGPNSEGGS